MSTDRTSTQRVSSIDLLFENAVLFLRVFYVLTP